MTAGLRFTTVDAGAQPFRLADVGEGPPVVLLHGFPDTPASWERTASLLVDAGHRVVVPFLRGYHRDTIVAGRPYGAAEQGEDVVRLLDALGLGSAVLVGHDWGAMCAWHALEAAPERVDGLVASAIPHPSRLRLDAAAAWAARHFVGLRLPLAARRLARSDGRYVATLYDRWAPDWRGPARDEALARARALVADPVVADHVVRWYRDLRPPARRPDPFDVPALLVAGERDMVDVGAFEASRRLFADPDGVELLVVPGAGHWPHREGEAAFHDALVGLLGRTA